VANSTTQKAHCNSSHVVREPLLGKRLWEMTYTLRQTTRATGYNLAIMFCILGTVCSPESPGRRTQDAAEPRSVWFVAKRSSSVRYIRRLAHKEDSFLSDPFLMLKLSLRLSVQQTNKFRGLSLRANYTDLATAACR
jgi:hypothetical protein